MTNKDIILKLINDSEQHLTAKQIFLKAKEMNPKIVLATIYNNLHKLVDEKKIRKVSILGKTDVYDRIYPHDHLICQNCGKINDIKFDNMSQQINKKFNIKIISYDLNIYYICDDCLNQFQQ